MSFGLYRKRSDDDAVWHFDTSCSKWPEADFLEQVYIEENEQLCPECADLEKKPA